ncbi:hypothetical protein [Desulfatibacillum aliphaticivorans]|uniref:hypothetical protein n=1 Tax=Desulfatibacillum aliphaticivorans TaxID=218208 RepID=UPI0003F5E5EC|nr:hypothetical protein [Desulfatibacillum aliphaticivorans]
MRKISIAALIIGFFFFAACSPGMDTPIKASSEEELENSIKSLSKNITQDEKKTLMEAMFFLAIKDEDIFSLLTPTDPDSYNKKMYGLWDGKTPNEIIKEANKERLDRKTKELDNIRGEIHELKLKKVMHDANKQELDSIIISNARFYHREGMLFNQPIIEFDIENLSSMSLARIFCHGVVSTPGRSVPWISEDFNHPISGGIEPGEKLHLTLAPNMFSEWGDKDAENRTDTILTVELVNIEGPDGEKVVPPFSNYDQKRLASLLENENTLLEEIEKLSV